MFMIKARDKLCYIQRTKNSIPKMKELIYKYVEF